MPLDCPVVILKIAPLGLRDSVPKLATPYSLRPGTNPAPTYRRRLACTSTAKCLPTDRPDLSLQITTPASLGTNAAPTHSRRMTQPRLRVHDTTPPPPPRKPRLPPCPVQCQIVVFPVPPPPARPPQTPATPRRLCSGWLPNSLPGLANVTCSLPCDAIVRRPRSTRLLPLAEYSGGQIRGKRLFGSCHPSSSGIDWREWSANHVPCMPAFRVVAPQPIAGGLFTIDMFIGCNMILLLNYSVMGVEAILSF